MGIYDRDYYRREGHSFLGSFAERGTICKWLIGINVVCYIIQMVTLPTRGHFDFYSGVTTDPYGPFTSAFFLNAEDVFHGQIWRLLTHAFLHSTDTPYHILFNMLFLWWFGSDVEDIYGPREFLAFYLVSAVAGGIAFVLTALGGMAGESYAYSNALGASGAVTAVMVLCAIHYPKRIIYLFFFLPVPIWLFVVFEIAQDSFTLLRGLNTGTAVTAHLGGAVFAYAYYKLHWRLMDIVTELKAWRKRRSQPRLRVFRAEEERPSPVGVTATPPPPQSRFDDEQLEAKMDAVLEKISRVGKENLTESEKEVLRRAAEVFKRRRRE